MSYRLFIFDLDGTLVDTSPGIMGTVRHVEKTLGIPPIPDEELRRFIGPPLEDSFMRYHGAAPERAKEMVACYRERYGAIGVGEAAVYPGNSGRHRRRAGGLCRRGHPEAPHHGGKIPGPL